jgi:peptidoglycan/xylan/chitin deacetylase (PgdA/CDA1 family)
MGFAASGKRRGVWPRFVVLAIAGAIGFVATLPRHPASAQTCGTDSLGVARSVEIDTQGGPRYGLMQYKDHDFLADGEVVLTFDDGPLRRHTQAILDALEKHCTKATFFMVGTMALSDPAMVREVARRGHTVASHTWSHRYQLGRVSADRAKQEIELGISAIQLALGAPIAPFFRFPFLSDQKGALAHLSERGIASFSIDVDALDYRSRGAAGGDAVFRRVMADLAQRKKGILLFHDIQPSTAAALPRILAALKAKGFKVVHIAPKASGTTLAEFDAMAEKEAGRRKSLVATAPLAPRAVTWPLAGAAPTTGWTPTAVVPATEAPAAQEPDWRRSVFPD